MNIKKWKEIQVLATSELTSEGSELRGLIAKAKFQRASGQLADRALVWRARKALARTLTALSSKSKQS